MWLTGNIFILLKEDAAQWGEDVFEVEFKFYKYTSYPLVVCSGSQIKFWMKEKISWNSNVV